MINYFLPSSDFSFVDNGKKCLDMSLSLSLWCNKSIIYILLFIDGWRLVHNRMTHEIGHVIKLSCRGLSIHSRHRFLAIVFNDKAFKSNKGLWWLSAISFFSRLAISQMLFDLIEREMRIIKSKKQKILHFYAFHFISIYCRLHRITTKRFLSLL